MGAPAERSKLVPRKDRDYSQKLRLLVQALFALLNLWIGFEFFLFVRHFETGGASPFVPRPPGVEGWLPIAALMNLKYFLATLEVPKLHPAALFLLAAFLAISFLLRKSFCSWLCPVGSLSEWVWKAGRRLTGRDLVPPRRIDVPLRGLKYLLLGLFLYVVATMTPAAIREFMETPYGLVVDVKMLHFFTRMTATTAVVLATLGVASIFVKNVWCRYLCPYGALMGLAALASPARIRRNPDACIDCGKCARACPSFLPVDRVLTVRNAECTGCMECTAVCPAEGALGMSFFRRRRLPAWVFAAGIAVLFCGIVALAKLAGRWDSDIPRETYSELIPRADAFRHP
jgi:polyferredoxin